LPASSTVIVTAASRQSSSARLTCRASCGLPPGSSPAISTSIPSIRHARVPAEVRPLLDKHFDRFQLSAKHAIELFEHLCAKHHNDERIRIQPAPGNLHWCSDEASTMLADCCQKHGVPFHMHLVETVFQKEYARRRGGGGGRLYWSIWPFRTEEGAWA
jgi:hypothetical protein